jgi:hypothetical protein
MGPEATQKYIDPSEYIKRLAAAQGIDVLNLVKTEQKLQEEQQQAQAQAESQSMTDQTGQILNSAMMDPSKQPVEEPPIQE